MTIKEIALSEITPYENNPRENDGAVDAVAKSIETFGFKVPLVIDKNNVIVAGHTRYKAAQKLEIEKIPCVVADDLTPEQVRAFRLIDNKTAELSRWNFDKLDEELDALANLPLESFNIDMNEFEFTNIPQADFDNIPDLTEENYQEPKERKLKCPNCGHEAGSAFFKKV